MKPQPSPAITLKALWETYLSIKLGAYCSTYKAFLLLYQNWFVVSIRFVVVVSVSCVGYSSYIEDDSLCNLQYFLLKFPLIFQKNCLLEIWNLESCMYFMISGIAQRHSKISGYFINICIFIIATLRFVTHVLSLFPYYFTHILHISLTLTTLIEKLLYLIKKMQKLTAITLIEKNEQVFVKKKSNSLSQSS